jgi:hypothetical protein
MRVGGGIVWGGGRVPGRAGVRVRVCVGGLGGCRGYWLTVLVKCRGFCGWIGVITTPVF